MDDGSYVIASKELLEALGKNSSSDINVGTFSFKASLDKFAFTCELVSLKLNEFSIEIELLTSKETIFKILETGLGRNFLMSDVLPNIKKNTVTSIEMTKEKTLKIISSFIDI